MARKQKRTFIENYNYESFNRHQIGHKKKEIISIYDFLVNMNLEPEDIDAILYNISYSLENSLNLPLYLNLITKSIGFKKEYSIDNIINIVRQIHDIYNNYPIGINLEEYLQSQAESSDKKIYLNEANKYTLENFKSNFPVHYITELKFAAAMNLSEKDYYDYISYLDDYQTLQETYAPLLLFKSYTTIRNSLKGNTKLFWDLLLGNEYVVSLHKNNIYIHQIFKEAVNLKLKSFQINSIYTSSNLPMFNNDQEFLMYYRNLTNVSNNDIVLPKLKEF